ncbi:hypothetical protein ACI65C_013450 [Semiaphis heraclei]
MATKRSKNVTDTERNILVKLIQPHNMSIIENIKVNTCINQTNSITERENEVLVDLLLTNKSSIDSSFDNQDEIWKTIAESYNQLQTSGIKTIDELKKCNKSLQKSASLDLNKEKSQTYKTGGGKSEHQSSSISSKLMSMMGNRLEPLESPYDCDGDFPGKLPISFEELPGITEYQSCGSGSPIYYTVELDKIVDVQAVATSTPCRNVRMKDNIDWLLNSNEYSAKDSGMDISIPENSDQPNAKNDFQTKNKTMTAASSKLKKNIPNKKLPTTTHTTANKVYESLENISNQRLGLYTSKEKFHENYNDLNIKRAKIELEIAEIVRNALIEKLKSDKEHYISQYKQDKLKEEILEHELNQKKQTIGDSYLVLVKQNIFMEEQITNNVTMDVYIIWFPKDETRRLIWIDSLNIKVVVKEWHRICSLHFSPDHFTFSNERKILKLDAIPIIKEVNNVVGSCETSIEHDEFLISNSLTDVDCCTDNSGIDVQIVTHIDSSNESPPSTCKRSLDFNGIKKKYMSSIRIGDLDEDDFLTPKRRKRNLTTIKNAVTNLRKKNRILTQNNLR